MAVEGACCIKCARINVNNDYEICSAEKRRQKDSQHHVYVQERKNLVVAHADEETTVQMLRKETDAAA